jgi:hypothetical protein
MFSLMWLVVEGKDFLNAFILLGRCREGTIAARAESSEELLRRVAAAVWEVLYLIYLNIV